MLETCIALGYVDVLVVEMESHPFLLPSILVFEDECGRDGAGTPPVSVPR